MQVAEPTPQQAYERMREYFTQPGAEISVQLLGDPYDVTTCYYRHPKDGRACAVGCLIPDEAYNYDWEGSASTIVADDLGWSNPVLKDFLWNAQSGHDGSETAAEFVAKLDVLADTYNLEVKG